VAATSATIANRALAHLGQVGRIVTLATDTTTEGKACHQFYDQTRTDTLKACPWACATKQATLTLVATNAATETREWLYRYRLPSDCLTPVRIVWGVRNPTADQQHPFRVVADTAATAYSASVTYATGAAVSSAGLWYLALRETVGDTPASSASDWVVVTAPPMFLDTDRASAILEYTYDLTDTVRFTPDLDAALAALLAYYVGPNVTVNGSAGPILANVYGIWQGLVSQAMANDYRAKQRDVPPASTYQAARSRRGV